MLGLKRGTVSLCPHQKDWESAALDTISRLFAIFGSAAVDIIHAGSTAIVHIQAKPILDITVGVRDLADVEPLIPALETAGFLLRKATPGVPEMLFVCGDMEAEIRTHHIHVVRYDSEEFSNYVNFRDYLNAHPTHAKSYEALKVSLLHDHANDRGSYTAGKHTFIVETLAKARVWQAERMNGSGRGGKWARSLIDSQLPDGSWGRFHSMSTSSGSDLTTERVLRRLEALGYTDSDEVIHRAVDYLEACLDRHWIPDPTEKGHHWDVYVDLMLATWIRRFRSTCEAANAVARVWAGIIKAAFTGGTYDHDAYCNAYAAAFGGRKPKGGRLIDFVQFYPLSLLAGMLDADTERRMLEYVLGHGEGIYYIYEQCVGTPPADFNSKAGARWLTAMELIARYPTAHEKLPFARDYLLRQQVMPGAWDMGSAAKDGICFPVSDRWDANTRRDDCTRRIRRLLERIG